MAKLSGTCLWCEKPFDFWPSQARKYCSMSCRSKHRAATKMPTKPRTGRYEPCEVCGEPVWRRQHQIRDGVGRYCSQACHNKAQTSERTERTCETCGATFGLRPSELKYRTGRYCSRACESDGRLLRRLDRMHNGRPAIKDSSGYIRLYEPGHPHGMHGGWVFEHRLVIEHEVGRYLTPKEHVHHINGVKDDNRRENLELLGHSEHSSLTQRERKVQLEEMRAELAEYRRRFGPLE